MSKTQVGYLLFAAGLAMITALLVGDVLTLWQSHGQMDSKFVSGMIAHYGAVISAFTGGGFLQQFGAKQNAISEQHRAELSDKVGV